MECRHPLDIVGYFVVVAAVLVVLVMDAVDNCIEVLVEVVAVFVPEAEVPAAVAFVDSSDPCL